MNDQAERKQARPGRRAAGVVLSAVVMAGAAVWVVADEGPQLGKWKVHDMSRPKPPVVTPGTASTPEQPGKPPSDAVVLFDGTNLDQWSGGQWKVEGGAMVAQGGNIQTKEAFGDCQLHIEWATPTPPKGESQGRGNSGVFLMGMYEVQVLDSYQSETYADGQAAALYGQFPPLVNASRPPGEWQTYDIIFRAPRFEGDKVKQPARVTVLHNGVLVQDATELMGRSAHKSIPSYAPHPEKLPIRLQDHGDPVRFRNIWIRPLDESKRP